MAAKTFEDVMKEMEKKKLSPEEMQKRLNDAKKICKDYCGECPTYVGTGETQLVFCWMSKSKKIKVAKGCMCPDCPVQRNAFQRWDYYCINGSAMEQLKAE